MHGFWLYFLNTAFPTFWVIGFLAMLFSWIFAETPTMFTGVVRSIMLTIMFVLLFIFGLPTLIAINTPG